MLELQNIAFIKSDGDHEMWQKYTNVHDVMIVILDGTQYKKCLLPDSCPLAIYAPLFQ